jgi:hypothetical protein
MAKYGDHLPLYRQAQMYAREGVDLDRSTLADWVGSSNALLDPLIAALSSYVFDGDKLHAVITGMLNPETGFVTATVTFVGGTGRFANASGSAAFTGQLLDGGAVEVSTNGTINY